MLFFAPQVPPAVAHHAGPDTPDRVTCPRASCAAEVVHYRLRAVTFSRKLASGLLLLYRLVAAGLLVMVGTYFLVYTVTGRKE